jgi:hypothetical protein
VICVRPTRVALVFAFALLVHTDVAATLFPPLVHTYSSSDNTFPAATPIHIRTHAHVHFPRMLELIEYMILYLFLFARVICRRRCMVDTRHRPRERAPDPMWVHSACRLLRLDCLGNPLARQCEAPHTRHTSSTCIPSLLPPPVLLPIMPSNHHHPVGNPSLVGGTPPSTCLSFPFFSDVSVVTSSRNQQPIQWNCDLFRIHTPFRPN